MQKVWLSGDRKLLLTNTAVTSSLLVISDVLQQWISGDYSPDQNKPFNVARTSLSIYCLSDELKSIIFVFKFLIFRNNFAITTTSTVQYYNNRIRYEGISNC